MANIQRTRGPGSPNVCKWWCRPTRLPLCAEGWEVEVDGQEGEQVEGNEMQGNGVEKR